MTRRRIITAAEDLAMGGIFIAAAVVGVAVDWFESPIANARWVWRKARGQE